MFNGNQSLMRADGMDGARDTAIGCDAWWVQLDAWCGYLLIQHCLWV